MKTGEISSLGTALPEHFKFHHDAGHGWLAVPYSAIESLGIENQVSDYSYRLNEIVFLEEDLDAVLFIKAYLKRIGRAENDFAAFKPLSQDVYDGNSSAIRGYPQYKAGKTQLFNPGRITPIENARTRRV